MQRILSVLTTIDLNDHLSFKTDEIQNIAIIRMLTTKFAAIELLAAEDAPHLLFSIRHVASECSMKLLFEYILVRLALHEDPSPT